MDKLEETIVNQEQIRDFVKRIGAEITHDYRGQEVYLIGILKGCFIFMADLIRNIDLPLKIDFMSVSSYDKDHSTGVVKIHKDVDADLTGKNVIIVEDIVDTGLTLSNLKKLLSTRNPASIRICTAFDKPCRRKVEVHIDYVGAEVPDEFLIGYGLDYDGYYRNIPEVKKLENTKE